MSANTNAGLAREYLGWVRDIKGRRPATVYNYASTLDALLTFGGQRPFSSLRVDDLEEFLLRPRQKARKNGRAAPGTLAKEANIVRGFFEYLAARGHIGKNPTVLLVAPKRPKREPRPIADDLWCHVWQHKNLTDEARVVLGLGFFCGLRRAEIAHLRPEQVDLATGTLASFEQKGGGEGSVPLRMMLSVFERELPALLGPGGTDSFVKPLRALVRARKGKVLLLPWAEEIDALTFKRSPRIHIQPPGMVDPQIAQKRLVKYLRDVGKPAAFTLHQLRYSCGTNLARAGVPVQIIQRLLRHADISTTQRYVRVSQAEMDEWYQSFTLRREGSRLA